MKKKVAKKISKKLATQSVKAAPIKKASESTLQFWSMELKTIGTVMPLIRILLVLRKFRVHIDKIQVDPYDSKHWHCVFLLEFSKSTRTDAIFRKLARLYDVGKLRYNMGKKVTHKAIVLK